MKSTLFVRRHLWRPLSKYLILEFFSFQVLFTLKNHLFFASVLNIFNQEYNIFVDTLCQSVCHYFVNYNMGWIFNALNLSTALKVYHVALFSMLWSYLVGSCSNWLLIPNRYNTSLLFDLMVIFGSSLFYLFGPSVSFSVIQFFI